MIKENITRGIEIKISRGDFKNGFIHSGCNYHYLLFPKGLIDKQEVAPQIGLIEFDQEIFSVRRWGMKYHFEGFKVRRHSRYQKISERNYNYVTGQMAYCATLQMIQWARDNLSQLTNYSATEEEKQ